MINFLLVKEFKQILRNPFLPKIIFIFPVVMLIVLPWAANFEIKNINLNVVDNDHSTYSKRLTDKIASSGYFIIADVSHNYTEALHQIETDKADAILEIPPHFEQDLVKEQSVKLMISANAVNGTKGGLSTAYLSGIITDFAADVRSEWVQTDKISAAPLIEIVSQNWFNPHLNYKIFMVPAIVVMLMTIMAGFLPALNIVSEKEAGTIEQINVSPVSKFTFILSKLIPYWIIGFIVLTLSFGVAFLLYGLVPLGHFYTIYFYAAIYILAISGFGLVVSNYSQTMQQAMFVMYFFMLIVIILSGLFTPINSMPQWAQNITIFNPLKYFMQVMRLVYLKGNSISELTTQFIALGSFAVFFNVWAVLSYQKKK